MKRAFASLGAICLVLTVFYSLAIHHIDKISLQNTEDRPRLFYKIKKASSAKPKKPKVEKRKKRKKAKKASPKPRQSPPKEQMAKKIDPMQKLENSPSENRQEDQVKDLADLEQDVVVIQKIIPKYPELARKAGIETQVFLEIIIDEKGRVSHASVAHISQPGYGFEQSALNAVKKLRFVPFMQDGTAIKVKVIYPISFVLIE